MNVPSPSSEPSLEYMTVKEVAGTLRKTPLTIYRWLEAGKHFVGVTKVGRDWLIPRHEVIRLLHSGRVTIH